MGFQSAGQSEPVGKPKGNDDAQEENSDVQNQVVSAEDKGIGIVKKRNENRPGQDSKTQGRGDTGVFTAESENHESRIQQHWEKQ